MQTYEIKIDRPLALVILDGWGYAPRTDGNAIAIAHTPYFDELSRKFPTTTLAAAGTPVGQKEDEVGGADVGHLNMGTGRLSRTGKARIKDAVRSGEFLENPVLNRAMSALKDSGRSLHLVGLLSDAGINSSVENLFALIRLAKKHELGNVFIHCILDGVDVPPRSADIFVEALEIKLADIGLGRIATLCGRYFAMDSGEHWERTARAFTMLVHGEGERTRDPIAAVRNSFLRGISDEFIAPVIVEKAQDVPVATVKSGDLVIFFNHRAEGMKQIVRSLCVADGTSSAKPVVETVCLTEYESVFNLPIAFRDEPEKDSLVEVLTRSAIPVTRITETARSTQMTYLFDGGSEREFGELLLAELPDPKRDIAMPESQSFKIADKLRRGIEAFPHQVFIVNLPAADLMAETGDLRKTVGAVQYIDTCLGGIFEKVREYGGVLMVTSTHGNCESMLHPESGEPDPQTTPNPVPFIYVDDSAGHVRLSEGGSLQDVAPTVLGILGIEKPSQMTGSDLRVM